MFKVFSVFGVLKLENEGNPNNIKVASWLGYLLLVSFELLELSDCM